MTKKICNIKLAQRQASRALFPWQSLKCYSVDVAFMRKARYPELPDSCFKQYELWKFNIVDAELSTSRSNACTTFEIKPFRLSFILYCLQDRFSGTVSQYFVVHRNSKQMQVSMHTLRVFGCTCLPYSTLMALPKGEAREFVSKSILHREKSWGLTYASLCNHHGPLWKQLHWMRFVTIIIPVAYVTLSVFIKIIIFAKIFHKLCI